MNKPVPTETEADQQRGTHYADGGLGAYDKVCYPDPKRIQEIHNEWATVMVESGHE